MERTIIELGNMDHQQMVEPLQHLLATGGPVLYVIAALSVLALAIMLLKLVHFAWLRVGRRGFIDSALAFWAAGDRDRALTVLAGTRNPIARTMEVAILGKADGKMDRHDLEEDVARDGVGRVVALRSYLRMLELIATLSPLLGLLGTVLGMIDAFQSLEAAGSRVNPAVLSGGVWIALLTTAAGLAVAIPVAAVHNVFEGVVERFAVALEDAATRVMVTPVREAVPSAQPLRRTPTLAARPAE